MYNTDSTDKLNETKIAIIGMAGRFPGASNVDAFWQNLQAGVESIKFFTESELAASGVSAASLQNPSYVKAKGVLEDIDLFDASFFGYAPREAALIDPQQRLFLECVWEAIEQAGCNPDTYHGRIGIYAGSSLNTYLLHNLCRTYNVTGQEHFYATMLANDKDFLATRAAYKCNLRGPAITVQTACSTALTATHLACQSLLNGETDIALAGGVTVRVPHTSGYLYQEGGILSPDGHCRAFDAAARGTVSGNGVGVVVLKRLADALADHDHIYAVILGSAMNNDGDGKAGYTAPSEEGQAAVIAEALGVANVEPQTVSYIETHGTATALGDAVEIAALTQIFGADAETKGYCAIGSVKTNIGHLDAAAGIAGLIKSALALKHQVIPPSLHFERANPNIDFANGPFYVNTRLTEWPAGPNPRRAGVSAFGVGGTNVHIVLEEPPALLPSRSEDHYQLLPLSAKTPESLERAAANLAAHLKQHPDIVLADVAYTLQVGRKPFTYRRFLVCRDRFDAIAVLEAQGSEQPITYSTKPGSKMTVFLFPGQGSQHVYMARELYQNVPLFRKHFDTCAKHMRQIYELDLHALIYPTSGDTPEARHLLMQTANSQPALFAIEYALAQLWLEWGIQPQAMIGHSIGEYVAACLAGVFSLEDALTLVAMRGRLMQAQPVGSMLAVSLPEQDILPLLGRGLSLAAINSPTQCVVSGPVDAIAALEDQLSQRRIVSRPLHTSHAFHSQMMEPVVEPFRQYVKTLTLKPPRIPFISNVTGSWISAAEATDPAYWSRQLNAPVRFSQGLAELLQQNPDVFLEVGPGHTLSTLLKRQVTTKNDHTIVSSLPSPNHQGTDDAFILNTLGQLWAAGLDVNWARVHDASKSARIPLPTYAFDRQRYWIEPAEPPLTAMNDEQKSESPVSTLYPRSHTLYDFVPPRNQREATIAEIWQRLLGIESIGIYDNFFDLGGDSLLAVQLINQLHNHFQIKVLLHHIVEVPTIASLGQLLQELSEQTADTIKIRNTPLVLLKDGTRPPFFCIHAAGGSAMSYVDLARYLDPDQPLYGLQAPGLYGDPQHESIESAASYYLDAIRSVQPQGPYYLGGLSYGGNVAFEMARQLHQQGTEVALLALFDSHPPMTYHYATPDRASFLAAFPWILSLMLEREREPITYEEIQQHDPQQQWEYVLGRIEAAGLIPPSVDIRQLYQYFDVWDVHHHALRSYDPPHKCYPQPITLFRAAQEQPAELLALLNIRLDGSIPIAGWEILSAAPVQVYEIPGSHYTILNKPHVQVLAKHLNALLAKNKKIAN